MKTKQENDYVLSLQYRNRQLENALDRNGQLENALAELLGEIKRAWENHHPITARVAKAWGNANLILNVSFDHEKEE